MKKSFAALAALVVVLSLACGSTPTTPPIPPITPKPLPVLSFRDPSPPTIQAGGQCQLTFSASTCMRMVLSAGAIALSTYDIPPVVQGGFPGYPASWGMATLVYPTMTTTYTVTASNANGSVAQSRTVTVQ